MVFNKIPLNFSVPNYHSVTSPLHSAFLAFLGKKKGQNEIPTPQQAFDDFVENYAKAHKKSVNEDIRVFNKLLSDIRNKKINQITKDDIQKIHLRIGENNGKIQANRVLQLLSTVCNRAINFGCKCENPTRGIQKFK